MADLPKRTGKLVGDAKSKRKTREEVPVVRPVPEMKKTKGIKDTMAPAPTVAKMQIDEDDYDNDDNTEDAVHTVISKTLAPKTR
jgi:hypothetical protein